MKLFFVAVFFSFLLAKSESLMLKLGKGSIEDDSLGSVILFIKNIMENSFLKDIPILEIINIPGMEEMNITLNTLLTYTPVFYILLLITYYIIIIPIMLLIKRIFI